MRYNVTLMDSVLFRTVVVSVLAEDRDEALVKAMNTVHNSITYSIMDVKRVEDDEEY